MLAMLGRVIAFLIAGGGGVILLVVSLIAVRFRRRRGMAITVTAIGSGLTVFGVAGALAVDKDLPTQAEYAIAIGAGLLALVVNEIVLRSIVRALERIRPGEPVAQAAAYCPSRIRIAQAGRAVMCADLNEVRNTRAARYASPLASMTMSSTSSP